MLDTLSKQNQDKEDACCEQAFFRRSRAVASVKWNFTESLPNLALSLKFFLTVCVSVASCERRAKLFNVETDKALSAINNEIGTITT